MIDDVSKSLQALLHSAAGEAEITFDPPTDAYKPLRTSLNLFLYDIRENLELRSSEPRVRPRAEGGITLHRAAARIACTYLVTAWAIGGEEPSLQEQRLLGKVLAVLMRYPTLPDIYLQGNLAEQEPPLPMIVAQTDALKAPHEFWSAIGNRLRPSLTVTVTVALEFSEPLDSAQLVQIHDIRLGDRVALTKPNLAQAPASADRYRIAGRVLDKEGTPVGNAIVSIKGTGIHARTDSNGRYLLGMLSAGSYQLRIQTDDKIQESTLTLPVLSSDRKPVFPNTELDVELEP